MKILESISVIEVLKGGTSDEEINVDYLFELEVVTLGLIIFLGTLLCSGDFSIYNSGCCGLSMHVFLK